MKRARMMAAGIVAALILCVSVQANACVGKTLVIGCAGTPDVSVVSQMISILITERTGTTVVVKSYGSFDDCMEALKACDINIMVDFTGRSYMETLGHAPEADPGKVFSEVKEAYQRDMNLVWLEPLGFSGASVMDPARSCGTPMMAAPVVRKDTLTKFPALPRVINKLAGKLDNKTVAELVKKAGPDDKDGRMARKVTRQFLKDKRLI